MSSLIASLPFVFLLAFPGPAATLPVDPAGCRDMKLFPRISGCNIAECGAKRLDSVKFQVTEANQESVDGASSFVRYSCAAPMTLEKLGQELVPLFKQVGFDLVYQDPSDPMNLTITARKAAQWVDVDASPDDSGVIDFKLTALEAGPAKPLSGEVCAEAGLLTLPKGCTLSDCNVKNRDTAEMRSTLESQVSLAGSIRVSGISCEAAVSTDQLFDLAVTELKNGGFQQVFAERVRPEYSWLTLRKEKRWVELMSFQDSEAISYQLTDVQTVADPKLQ